MSELHMPPKLVAIAQTTRITAENVRGMRREVFGDDKASQTEAQWLIDLDNTASEKCTEWKHFYVDALTDYIVNQAKPEGVISNDNAQWLVGSLSKKEAVDISVRHQMLVKVLQKAQASPDFLVRFVLEQISKAICEGVDLSAHGFDQRRERYVIQKQDVEHICQVMYAFGGDGGMAVTRTEAEFLFDLNDRTLEFDNDPAWSNLFVRAVGNYLMATLGNRVATRNVALMEDTWLEGEGLFDMMINSLRSVFSTAVSGAEATETAMAQTNEAKQALTSTAEEVDAGEAAWVAERIGADGILHQNEKALLHFLKEESHSLHPSLKVLLQKAA